MSLIKSAKSDRILRDAIVLDMGDLARQAERILQTARTDAAQLIEDARAEAQRLIEGADARGYAEGLERGHADGYESGSQEGRQLALSQATEQIKNLEASWRAALEIWESQRRAWLHEAREDSIRFAFAVAERIVHRLVKADPTIIADQVAAALALLSRPTSVEITIHPDDRPLVEQTLPVLLSEIASCEHSVIRPDAAIERGGCIVATRGGRIDATIQTQLDRIAEALVPLPSASGEPPSKDSASAP